VASGNEFYTSWKGNFKESSFQGITRTLAGQLRGKVTIDKIAAGEIQGRLSLSGPATLYTRDYRFTYSNSGRISGDESTERQREGTITLEGQFRAPNLSWEHDLGDPRLRPVIVGNSQ